MQGIENISNEELLKLAGKRAQPSTGIQSLSDNELLSLAKGLPQQPPYPAYSTLAQDLIGSYVKGRAALSGAQKGIGDILSGAGRLGARALSAVGFSGLEEKVPRYQPSQSDQMFMAAHPGMSAAGQFAGESLPLAFLPESAFGELEAIAPAVDALPKGLQGLARLAGKSGKQAAVGAPLGAIYDPDKPTGEAMETGALLAQLGPVAEGAIGLTKGAFNSLIKLGGMATKENAHKVMNAAENLGLQIPAAEVIKSKPLKTLQETLGSIPGTGMPEAYNNLSSGLQEQIGILSSKLNPDNVHSGSAVQVFLQDKYRDAKNVANHLYSSLGDAIDKLAPGKIHDNEFLSKKAISIENEFKEKASQPGGSTRIPSDVKNIINQISRTKYSLRDATEIDENINALIGDNIADIKRGGREGQNAKRAVRYLKQLKEANNRDIENTIDNQGIPEISSLWSKAKQHYKTEISPFIEKGSKLQEILNEVNPDKIQSKFLNTSGVQPRSFQLRKVTEQLPQEVKDKIAHQYLVGPKGETEKILTKFEKLQPEQKKILFSNEDLKTLEDMLTIKNHFGGEFNQMLSPKTGYQVLKFGVPAAIYGAGASEDGVPGGLAALGAAALGGRGLKKALMSPKLQRQFLKEAEKPSKTEIGLLGLLGIPEENQR